MTKESIGTLSLFNRQTRKFAHATLYRGFDEKNMHDIEDIWMPMLRKIRQAQRGVAIVAPSQEVRDAHWEWSKKMSKARTDALVSDVFVIECDDMTQAAMIVRKGTIDHQSLHKEHLGGLLVYVDYVATAPWNREIYEAPLYKGCGLVMLATAISLSIEDGYGGRLALKSLRGAESFYRDNLGMTEIVEGMDEDGLKYFELPVSQVGAVLNRFQAAQGAER